MKRILLTTTSLILAAGVVSAETSISWSGTATAGVAREGAAAASVTTITANDILTARLDILAVDTTATSSASSSTGTDTAITAAVAAAGTATVATLLVNITSALANLSLGTSNAAVGAATIADNAAAVTELNRIKTYLTAGAAVAAGTVGDFASYSEVSTTVKGSVSTDNGMTITAAVSVDAGTGYDFADDDGFDAAKTNGVGLDNVTVATAMGTFKIDQNAVTHLVDGDDDGAADLLYTNTFGTMSISAAIDLNKDGDATAVRGKTARGNNDGTVGELTTVAAVAADVAWSAKVSMPVAGGSAYVAMDEEGGNIFGASTTLSGIGISFSSKLEALEEEESADRENNLGLTYAMGATTLGASWNSKEDGDQWGISAAYAADGMTISASTDEGSDWSVSGSMALGGGASAVAGVNYTEDAYLGLSFAF